ncbi:MAG: prepilin-type N-terminal cleavage/methylation domain-containing protein [Humidesulfovibrio sp.]|nr:prepilin-type N-terminal cleavage/methylation domain-containing protein [Humidesulfovibrio sp.]
MTLKKLHKGQGGFTLIELVAVVIILGILAAVIVPKYFDMTSKAQDAAYKGALNEGVARFNMSYAQYVLNTSTKPADLTGLTSTAYLGSSLSAVNIGDYNIAYALASSTVTLTLSNSANSALKFSTGSAATTAVPWPQ